MRKAIIASTVAAASAIGAAIIVGRVTSEKLIVPELFRDEEPFRIETDPYLSDLTNGQPAVQA